MNEVMLFEGCTYICVLPIDRVDFVQYATYDVYREDCTIAIKHRIPEARRSLPTPLPGYEWRELHQGRYSVYPDELNPTQMRASIPFALCRKEFTPRTRRLQRKAMAQRWAAFNK